MSSSDFILAFWSLIAGMLICVIYDLFRITRLRREQNKIVLFFLDLAFCLVSTCVMLVLFFNLSFGRMRIYAVAFALVGFSVWRITVSRPVIALLISLLDFLERVLNSLKMRIASSFRKASRFIYTVYYCKTAVGGIKKMKLKRKEVNDEPTKTGTD